MVLGELDWSPSVHDQIIGRVSRDGNTKQVTAIYPVCDYGSDPTMIQVLGLKAEQSYHIINPGTEVPKQHSDQSRVKLMAENYLKGNKNKVS